MTDVDPRSVNAGQMVIDVMRTCDAEELKILTLACRHHKATAIATGTFQLAELWNVLGVAADHLLSAHPDLLTDLDIADLDALGDTPGGD